MKKRKKFILRIIVLILIFFSLVVLSFIFTFRSSNQWGNLVEDTGTISLTGKLLTSNPKVRSVPGNSGDSMNCDEMRRDIDFLFEEARKCEKDSDCVVENKGMFCPFGCFQIHNKAYDIAEIMQKVRDFQTQKCYLCEYSCMTPPKQEQLKCQNNRCIDARYTR